MKKLIFIFFTLALFISCNKQKEPVEVVKSIELETEFVDVFYRFMGYFYDNNLQQEFVYLADPKDCIKIFNIKGKHVNTVPLKNAIRALKGSVGGISPYSTDTIFLFSDYRNNIAAVNNSGKIIRSLHIDDILPDSSKNMFDYYTTLPYQLNEEFRILLWPCLNDFTLINKFGKEDLDRKKQLIFYYSYILKQPYLLEIKDLFNNSIKANFHLYDYYKKYHTADNIGMAYDYLFKPINSFLFIISGTSNEIHKINNKNDEYLQDLEINSNFTNIGFKSIAPEDFPVNYKIQNDKLCYKGSINNIFYNSKEKKYYVIVAHELKNIEEWKKLHNGDYRPFSVIIYDENFENHKEYAFEAHSYICRNSFMSEEGLWMQRKPEKLTKENYGTQTFDLLEFN